MSNDYRIEVFLMPYVPIWLHRSPKKDIEHRFNWHFERSSMSDLNNELAEKLSYLKKNPSAFMEEVCGIKLSIWQRYIIDNISKFDPTPRKPMRRWNFYLELCWKYLRMNDDEYVVIASPKKWEKLSKTELLEYIENYWK